MTVQDAADFLNISPSFLISLLEQGEIPCMKVGAHHYIRMSDLIAYKQSRDAARKRGLAELAHISEDEGMYD